MVTKKITRVIILWRFTHPSNRSLKFFSFFFKYRFCLVLVSFRCVGNRKSSSRRVISFCNARWVLVASFRGNGFHVRDFYTCKNRDWCEWGCVFWFEWNFLKKEKYCYYFSFQFGFIELRGALYREILLSKMFKLVRLQNETYRKSSRDLLYSIALSINVCDKKLLSSRTVDGSFISRSESLLTRELKRASKEYPAVGKRAQPYIYNYSFFVSQSLGADYSLSVLYLRIIHGSKIPNNSFARIHIYTRARFVSFPCNSPTILISLLSRKL